MQAQKFGELYTRPRVYTVAIRINWKSKRSIENSWHWSIYPTRLNQATKKKKNKGSKESIAVMPVSGGRGLFRVCAYKLLRWKVVSREL